MRSVLRHLTPLVLLVLTLLALLMLASTGH